MRVFIAGATGAIGRRLVPLLAASGHELIGTTRSADKAEALRELGAAPVVLNGLDREAVSRAVLQAAPGVVIQEQTALSGRLDLRRLDRAFAATNALRTRGTEYLLEAAVAAEPRASSPRASPAGRTPARAGRSRPRRTRSTRDRPGR